eukprot:3223485-Rhodomonas_salina.7
MISRWLVETLRRTDARTRGMRVRCVESCMAFMDGVQEHALAAEMIKNITLEDVNAKAAEYTPLRFPTLIFELHGFC